MPYLPTARVTKNLWPSLMHVTITKEMIRMSIVFSFFLILEFHLESKIESVYLLSWDFFPVDNQNNVTSHEPWWMIIHSFFPRLSRPTMCQALRLQRTTQALCSKGSQYCWGSQEQQTKDMLGDRKKATWEEERTWKWKRLETTGNIH